MTEDARSFSYYGSGQLQDVTDAGTLKAVRNDSNLLGTYTYNHRFQRTRKVAAATDPRPLPNANGQGAAAVNTHRPPMPSQARTPGDRSNRTSATGTDAANPLIYLHTDHLNTPRLATNATGAKVWLWAGEAFGNTPPNEDVDGDGKKTVINLRYAGQYYDGESGLHYNWNRYYDPELGMYITSDPIGLEGGLNTYLYANVNPLRFTDPLGLSPGLCPSGFTSGWDPHAGFYCKKDPNYDRPCATAECAADVLPNPPVERPTKCQLGCIAIAEATCAPVKGFGKGLACAAAVEFACRATTCRKDKCDDN